MNKMGNGIHFRKILNENCYIVQQGFSYVKQIIADNGK